MKICILYSGGLDSFIMKRLADKVFTDDEVICVWYNIGQAYNAKEEAALPPFVIKRKVDWLQQGHILENKDGSSSGNIIIPGRNAVMVQLAASQFLPDEIWLGALHGEMHSQSTDKNEEFRMKMNSLLSYVYPSNDIRLVFPLAEEGFGKFESVDYAIKELGVTEAELLATSSCLSAEEGNCGHCVVCARRWGIFKQLGITERYNIHPFDSKNHNNIAMLKEMIEGVRGNPCHYDKYRIQEIIPAILMDYIGYSTIC